MWVNSRPLLYKCYLKYLVGPREGLEDDEMHEIDSRCLKPNSCVCGFPNACDKAVCIKDEYSIQPTMMGKTRQKFTEII